MNYLNESVKQSTRFSLDGNNFNLKKIKIK